jgi:DNA (cytosine-5)-methyltransferase 1
MGYSVEAGLFSAAECGAPHRRERLFILAGRQNANRWGHMQVGQAQGRIALDRTSEGMAHPKCSEPGQRIGQEPQTTGRWDRLAECGMPDSASQRIQGNESKGIILAEGQIDESRWPARPGQPQYEWEASRTIPYTKKQRLQGFSEKGKRQRKSNEPSGQTQLRLGRATSRTASRVDRLRLLGNGVVPQQAEKAFRELWTRIESTRAPGSRCPKRRARRGLKEWVE